VKLFHDLHRQLAKAKEHEIAALSFKKGKIMQLYMQKSNQSATDTYAASQNLKMAR